MPRKRIVSPEFFAHADLYDAEASCRLPLRLAFAGLWCQADRRGVFTWRPRELKLACLPHDPIDFGAVLSALEEAGFVQSYWHAGRRYGVIPSFGRWQSFHHAERPSDAPGPLEADADSVSTWGKPRSKTVPTPGQPRTSLTASASASASVTASAAASAAVVRADDPDHLRLLTAAANKGIAEQYGEQPVPLRWDHPGTLTTCQAFEQAAMPLEYAEACVYQLAVSRKLDKPPRTLRYFAAAAVESWVAEQAYRDAATLPSVTLAARPGEPKSDTPDAWAVSFAQEGSAEWQAYCDARGIEWQVAS